MHNKHNKSAINSLQAIHENHRQEDNEKVDFYQPVEQAGFRSGFSTNDHLQVMRTLIEKCNEYKIPIVLISINYEKASDSVEIWPILEALNECRLDSE